MIRLSKKSHKYPKKFNRQLNKKDRSRRISSPKSILTNPAHQPKYLWLLSWIVWRSSWKTSKTNNFYFVISRSQLLVISSFIALKPGLLCQVGMCSSRMSVNRRKSPLSAARDFMLQRIVIIKKVKTQRISIKLRKKMTWVVSPTFWQWTKKPSTKLTTLKEKERTETISSKWRSSLVQ